MSELIDGVRFLLDSSHWWGPDGIAIRLREHLVMSVWPLLAATVLGLPIGVGLGHWRRFGVLAINVSNIGRALPSFGILAIGFAIWGIDWQPAFVALFALALPPIVTNSYVAMTQVDQNVVDAALGMGFTSWQRLRQIELPIAMPLVVAGIRTAAVAVVATATLAAEVAGGGLGRFIVDGIATRDFDEVVAGAILVAAVAMATELGLAIAQRATSPEVGGVVDGSKRRRSPRATPKGGGPTGLSPTVDDGAPLGIAPTTPSTLP